MEECWNSYICVFVFVFVYRCMCTDIGHKHSCQVSLSVWQWKAGNVGQGETAVPRSPRQVWECLPGAMSPRPHPTALLGGGVARTLGGCRCGCEGDPSEGELSPLWVRLHWPVLESVLLWGSLQRSARPPASGNTSTSVSLPQGRSIPGLARGHPVLLQRLLWDPQPPLHVRKHLHRASLPWVWDGGGWLLCYYLYIGGDSTLGQLVQKELRNNECRSIWESFIII